MFVITTDGMENASCRYSADAVETARRYGIDFERAVDYRADPKGTQTLYESVSEAASMLR